jgi:hypothetical protein
VFARDHAHGFARRREHRLEFALPREDLLLLLLVFGSVVVLARANGAEHAHSHGRAVVGPLREGDRLGAVQARGEAFVHELHDEPRRRPPRGRRRRRRRGVGDGAVSLASLRVAVRGPEVARGVGRLGALSETAFAGSCRRTPAVARSPGDRAPAGVERALVPGTMRKRPALSFAPAASLEAMALWEIRARVASNVSRKGASPSAIAAEGERLRFVEPPTVFR